MKQYQSFHAFYPFYLSQHSNVTCRRLHVVGTTLALAVIAYACWSAQWLLLLLAPVMAYGCAWIGHFYFEKNVPATFTYPLYSLMGDCLMYWQIVTGQLVQIDDKAAAHAAGNGSEGR